MKSAAASSDLESLPALKVLLRARAEGRMPHAVLLTGPNPELLQKVADRLASIHLEVVDPIAHADCRVLRPSKKSRRINVENTLEVVTDLRLTSVSARRVVIVHEPDRFESIAANAFLKTLEEPPAGTLIILQTTNYYRVLPTILSRCLRFHVGGATPELTDAAWADWLREFDKLMGRLAGAGTSTGRSTEVVMPLYALCARFEVLLELFVEEALKAAPSPPPTDQDEDDAEIAYEDSIRRGIRTRMLAALEERLRLVGRAHPSCGLQVAEAVDLLEQARIRLELNYQIISALEGFFLRTLRVFAARPLTPTS
jgi:DNA polymerase-3 subunit delta'